MNLRLFPVDDQAHRDAAELLPWLLNGTLEPAERARVEAHLGQCIACRRELDDERRVQAAVRAEPGDAAVASGLSRLHSRIQGFESGQERGQVLERIARHWRAVPRWAQAALVAPFAVAVFLIAAQVASTPPQVYRTLSAPSPAVMTGASLVVVFDPGTSEADIRDLLVRLRARITDGPSPEGAYALAVEASDQSKVLSQLRRERSVLFAEPAPPH